MVNAPPQLRYSRDRMLIVAGLAFTLGATGCWLLVHRSMDKQALPACATEAFAVLARHGNMTFPETGIACEIVPSQGRLSIGDFMGSYVHWSHNRGQRGHSSLDCQGDPLVSCVWVFGESKSNEGWGAFPPLSVRSRHTDHYGADA